MSLNEAHCDSANHLQLADKASLSMLRHMEPIASLVRAM